MGGGMRSALVLIALCLLPAGCAGVGPFVPDTARLAPGALGSTGDPDIVAMNQAQWAFADPSRTYGRPVDAARAAASMEYIAGEFSTSPRWSAVPVLTRDQLLQGRQEVRQALGVVPGTPSQVVVDRLVTAANALAAGDRATAVQLLGPPAFRAPGEQVLARLSNMPYLQMANVSTMRAGNQLFPSDAPDWGE